MDNNVCSLISLPISTGMSASHLHGPPPAGRRKPQAGSWGQPGWRICCSRRTCFLSTSTEWAELKWTERVEKESIHIHSQNVFTHQNQKFINIFIYTLSKFMNLIKSLADTCNKLQHALCIHTHPPHPVNKQAWHHTNTHSMFVLPCIKRLGVINILWLLLLKPVQQP